MSRGSWGGLEFSPDDSGRTHVDAGLGTRSGPSFARYGSQYRSFCGRCREHHTGVESGHAHTLPLPTISTTSRPTGSPPPRPCPSRTAAKSWLADDLAMTGDFDSSRKFEGTDASLRATAPGGAPAHPTDCVTAADGSYSFTTAPHAHGRVGVVLRFGGDVTHYSASEE